MHLNTYATKPFNPGGFARPGNTNVPAMGHSCKATGSPYYYPLPATPSQVAAMARLALDSLNQAQSEESDIITHLSKDPPIDGKHELRRPLAHMVKALKEAGLQGHTYDVYPRPTTAGEWTDVVLAIWEGLKTNQALCQQLRARLGNELYERELATPLDR